MDGRTDGQGESNIPPPPHPHPPPPLPTSLGGGIIRSSITHIYQLLADYYNIDILCICCLYLPKSDVRWLVQYRLIISTVLQFCILIWRRGPIYHMCMLHSYSYNYYITECRKNQLIKYVKAPWKRGTQRNSEMFLDMLCQKTKVTDTTGLFLMFFVNCDNVISCTLLLKWYLLNDLSP